ncbi:hypothetical protein [Nocardia asiatica]|uniref:hypothetical protein n=1 Tax=Nocardia asiatica TaxID=209252 RepID=UPI003EE3FEAE
MGASHDDAVPSQERRSADFLSHDPVHAWGGDELPEGADEFDHEGPATLDDEHLPAEECNDEQLHEILSEALFEDLATSAQISGPHDSGAVLLTEAAEALDRVEAEKELFEVLREHGFDGPAWSEFVTALLAYGTPVLDAWMRSGYIFVVARRIWLKASQAEQDIFAKNSVYREEFTNTVLADAVVKFQKALKDNAGWNPARGQSPTTYFITTCVHVFVDEFRKQRRYRRRYVDFRDLQSGQSDLLHPPYTTLFKSSVCVDPEKTVINAEVIREHLDMLTGRDRIIVWAKAHNYTAPEIVEMFRDAEPSTSRDITPKAIERRWARLRKKHDWIARLSVRNR